MEFSGGGLNFSNQRSVHRVMEVELPGSMKASWGEKTGVPIRKQI